MRMKEQTNAVETSVLDNVWMVGAGMLVVGLIVGFFVGWFWQKNGSSAVIEVKDSNTSTTSNVTAVPVPAMTYQTIDVPAFVSVDDQKAGSLVFVKHTEASKPTWVAVREMVDGTVGNILGAEMVTGATDDVPVTLLRPTVAGQKYSVFLYQDDGNGEFDFKKDLLVMQNKMPVAAMFTAQ